MGDFKGFFGSSRAGLHVEPAPGHRGSNRTQIADTSDFATSNAEEETEVKAEKSTPGKTDKPKGKGKKTGKSKG